MLTPGLTKNGVKDRWDFYLNICTNGSMAMITAVPPRDTCQLLCTYCICIMKKGGYTVKYSLSTREIPRADIIQTLSISKSYTSSVVLTGRAILEELILRIGLAAGAIFSRIAQSMKQYGSVWTQ